MALSSLVSDDSVHPLFIWRDGEIVPWAEALVHVNSVGHASVSAVFEGIKAYWNEGDDQLFVFRLREHMERLLESLRIARLGSHFTVDALVEGALALLRANSIRRDTYIRPWSFVKGFVYEQIAAAQVSTETVIDTWPFRSQMLTRRGCKACVSSWTRIGDNVMPPRAKVFSNYHNSRLAVVEARLAGYDWPILLNERHKVTEGPGACVAIVRGHEVITPSLTSGVLESLTRDSLLRILREVLGTECIEREVDRTELYVADEIFFMGTGWEVLPVLEIDGLTVGNGRMGPVAEAIDRAYHDTVRGVDGVRYELWRTPVY